MYFQQQMYKDFLLEVQRTFQLPRIYFPPYPQGYKEKEHHSSQMLSVHMCDWMVMQCHVSFYGLENDNQSQDFGHVCNMPAVDCLVLMV